MQELIEQERKYKTRLLSYFLVNLLTMQMNPKAYEELRNINWQMAWSAATALSIDGKSRLPNKFQAVFYGVFLDFYTFLEDQLECFSCSVCEKPSTKLWKVLFCTHLVQKNIYFFKLVAQTTLFPSLMWLIFALLNSFVLNLFTRFYIISELRVT